jgi:hypothetical protein
MDSMSRDICIFFSMKQHVDFFSLSFPISRRDEVQKRKMRDICAQDNIITKFEIKLTDFEGLLDEDFEAFDGEHGHLHCVFLLVGRGVFCFLAVVGLEVVGTVPVAGEVGLGVGI